MAAESLASANNWNMCHMLDNDVQASSYSREQLTGMISTIAGYGCKYLRLPWQFHSFYRSPLTPFDGNLLEWFFYTAFQHNIIPMIGCYGHPTVGQVNWEAYIPADGRYRHVNKPESEHQTLVLNSYRDMFDRLAAECSRAGIPTSRVPVQNGNELGKGGSIDWRPYPGQTPANPEAASADGTVPQSVVTFRSALLSVIREYGFMAVSPSMEAETTTILTAELNTANWLDVINAHDKIAVHSYPETSGNRTRCQASADAATAFVARRDIIRNTFGITKPIWVTEIGRLQSECVPSGTGVSELMGVACKRLGAEEVFPFTICMDSNNYATNVKTDFSKTAPTWPGDPFPP